MTILGILTVATISLTYLSVLGYLIGYFVLVPALRKKFGWKADGKSFPWFDNFLYTEHDLKILSSHTDDPAVASTLKLIKFSEYSFLFNFILLMICLDLSLLQNHLG